MNFVSKRAAVALIALALAACATETDFVRPTYDQLSYGHSTYTDVIHLRGVAGTEGITQANGQQVRTVTYTFAGEGKGTHFGVAPAKAVTYFFAGDVLIGQEYTSSYVGDSTDFDPTLVSHLTKGLSTRDDAIHLFGLPGGRLIYPMIPARDGDALAYTFAENYPGMSPRSLTKTMLLIFDHNGLLVDVQVNEMKA